MVGGKRMNEGEEQEGSLKAITEKNERDNSSSQVIYSTKTASIYNPENISRGDSLHYS